jgi:hypothetical protein
VHEVPEGRSVFAWLRAGWHVALAYVIGFFVMLAVIGWHPQLKRHTSVDGPTVPSYATMEFRPQRHRGIAR